MPAVLTLPCADAPATAVLTAESLIESYDAPNEPAARIRARLGSRVIASALFFTGYEAPDLLELLDLPVGINARLDDAEEVAAAAQAIIHEDTSLFVVGAITPAGEQSWRDISLAEAPFAYYTELFDYGTHYIWHDGSQGGWAHAQRQLDWARSPLSPVDLHRYDEAARSWRLEPVDAQWRLSLTPLTAGGFVPTLYLEDSRGNVCTEVEYGPDHFHGEIAFCPSFVTDDLEAALGQNAREALAALRSLYRAFAAGRVQGPLEMRFPV